MLKHLELKNFKRIKEEPLYLDYLGSVNYMVGENGSGKSSILEYLYLNSVFQNLESARFKEEKLLKEKLDILFDPDEIGVFLEKNEFDNSLKGKKCCFITSDLNFKYFEKLAPGLKKESTGDLSLFELIKILESLGFYYFTPFDVSNPEAVARTSIKNKDQFNKFLSFFEKLIDKWNRRHPDFMLKKKKSLVDVTSNSAGKLQVYKIFYFVAMEVAKNGDLKSIFLFEEPEANLHPQWQKMIPEMMEFLSFEVPDSQYFISTHSPFVISSAGEIVENDLEKSGYSRSKFEKKYRVRQKIYLIEKGQCRRSEGSWGFNAVGKSAKIVGAGLGDVVGSSAIHFENRDSWIIYCEGSNEDFSDADCYNLIFKNIPDKHVLFISCGSSTEVAVQYQLAKELNEKSRGRVNIVGLVDRDEDNDQNMEYAEIGLKVLGRREIENYICDPQVVNMAFDKDEKKYLKMLGVDENQFREFDIKEYFFEKTDQNAHRKFFIEKDITGTELRKILSKSMQELRSEPKSSNNVFWELYSIIFE